jgi:hypothetical protein
MERVMILNCSAKGRKPSSIADLITAWIALFSLTTPLLASGPEPTARFRLSLADPPPGHAPYPEGTVLEGSPDQPTLTATGRPLRLWLDLFIENWDPDHTGSPALGSWTITLDTSPASGSSGQISLAVEPCIDDSDCYSAFGSGARCADPPENPQYCTPVFQDLNRCAWAFDRAGHPGVQAPYETLNGTTNVVGPLADPGRPVYAGTFVYDISSDAAGTFSPGILEVTSSEMLDEGLDAIAHELPSNVSVTVPTGRCCNTDGTCTEGVTQAECKSGAPAFGEDGICPQNGGPPCAGCALDSECSNFPHPWGLCAVPRCIDLFCTAVLLFDPESECCNPANGQSVPLSDGNPCTQDICNNTNGTVQHLPIPEGGVCDDGRPCTHNTVCNALGQCVGWQNLNHTCPKNRYASFSIEDVAPSGCHEQHAIRVTFHEIDGFPAMNGQTAWVGEPALYQDIDGGSPSIAAAELQCTPFLAYWTPYELVHVFGVGVVPNSRYLLEILRGDCPDISDPSCYFGALIISTAKWGDVVHPHSGSSQPNFADVSAVIDSFRSQPDAPNVTRADLVPSDPNQLVNFADVSAGVDAFRGMPYSLTGPTPCP